MTIWRYTAVARDPAKRDGGPSTGELAADTAAEVRASLRRIGLLVVELRPVRRARRQGHAGGGRIANVGDAARETVNRWQRQRRRDERAELYDGLATMLSSGVPLLEACATLAGASRRRRSSTRAMLVDVRESLRGGSTLAEAMTDHQGWFDPAEIAMVRAGHHGGTLAEVLRSLAERHERSGALTQKLLGALAYPTIVTIVGLGVVVFLSVKTLPSLVQVIHDAGLEPPGLTLMVMAFGQTLAAHWFAIVVGLAAIALGSMLFSSTVMRRTSEPPTWMRACVPKVLRRMAVARVVTQLAEMLRSGVPLVDALRVITPAASGPILRKRLVDAANAVERGDELSSALSDEQYFDAEFRRLLDVGQSTGELDTLLERVGERYARQASRLIDRLATLLEPAIILTLAALVGVVVMAAILPLLRLQEVL